MKKVYFDNSASTAVLKESADKACDIMQNVYGNPSSLHKMGISAETELNGARGKIAKTLSCSDSEIYFTSGGTEGNNLAIIGACEGLNRRGNRIVTTEIEHPSVINTFLYLKSQGFETVFIKPNKDGVITREIIEEAVTPDTILVSVMAVNNETGLVLPVQYIKNALAKVKSPAVIHTDAVQAYGKLKFTPSSLGADIITLSGHKIHAPKGVGAVYVKKGIRIVPQNYGGGQEKNIRNGTENLPGIAAFGVSAKYMHDNFEKNREHIKELRIYCESKLKQEINNMSINSPKDGLADILNISLFGCRSEVVLHFLEERGIFISSGSACSSKKRERNYVLSALGFSDSVCDSAIRISFSFMNTKDEIDLLSRALLECSKKFSGDKK